MDTGSTINRRKFLGGVAAQGAGSLLTGCETTAGGGAGGAPYRIDVHHHFLQPSYAAEFVKRGGPPPMKWSAAASLEDMDRSGIACSITSIWQVGALFRDVDSGRRLSRESNEFATTLARDYPGRFGTFATIPLTDTDGALKEIAYACDVLKVEGVHLLTSYNGRYLGDKGFWPVMEELDRRRAVVYTHPLSAQCCANVLPGIPDATLELPADTTRTIASVLFSGTASRFPNIRWIWSHSGGTTPFMLSRFIYEEKRRKDSKTVLPNGVAFELAKFNYDMAQGNHNGALYALGRIAPVSQYVYGTDFPYRSGDEVNKGIADYPFTAAERIAIERGNALKLMPSLAATLAATPEGKR
jgi:predicted TIM-barrel fold metal-dependent hydrolase